MEGGRPGWRAERQAEIRLLPWHRRPRPRLREVLYGPNWRIAVFPFIFAPLAVGKLAWPLWGGPETATRDWLLLVLALVPWAYLAAWLRRPVSYHP